MKIGNYILAALVLLFLTHSAHALDPSQPFSSYIQTRFTRANGLTSDIVNEVMPTPDGFLWMTDGALILNRFDGHEFYEVPLGHPAFTMALGPDGDLWVGGKNELVQIPATIFNQIGPLQAISHPTGLSQDKSISCLHFSRNGILWVGTLDGLYRFEHGVFSSTIPDLYIQRIEEASNGDLLLTTTQGFIVWDGSRAVPHPELATQLGLKVNDIYHVFDDSRGVTWILTSFGVARRVGNTIEKLQPWGPKDHGAFKIYEDPQGNVWISGTLGLFRATAKGLELAIKGTAVRYMRGDRDGNLWIATNGDGLFRFKDRAVRMFTTADGLPGNVPMAVLTSHDGTLWTGFNCGGLAHYDGHTLRIYKDEDGLLNNCVWSLAEDANNDLWIGTHGGGVFRFRNGTFTQYTKLQGLLSNIVTSILPARDGSLWLVTPNGLSRLRGGQVRNYTVADGLSNRRVTAIYEDRHGGIWAGTGLGIDHLEGDHFVNSLLVGQVTFPFGDDSSGAIYFGTNTGLSRLNNGASKDTAISPEITGNHLIETGPGDLWISGIPLFRVTRANLEKPLEHDEPLDVEIFGLADGMNSDQCSLGHPNSALTPDGKLWVATVQGLAMLDLPHLPKSDRKPTIYMKEFMVGRDHQLPSQQLVLPAGTSHVELHFDAIEITSPEKIRMQYRLDGIDSEWLDVKPLGKAVYSTIPPGTHAFHVRACNRDGIWDRTGMVYLVIQKPFFYQTTWFRLAVIATALLMVVGLYRLRLRQVTAHLNARFDERLAERTRIARELHDTLLQTVQGSKLVADNALEKPNDAGHLHQAMRQLSGWLGQATQEGRAALNSLRTSTLDTNDLAEGLRRATEECVIDRSMAVKFSETGRRRNMHPIARDEIYRIGYEAIRNACEHASASELEIILTYAQDLTLRVRDNGIGMEAAVVTEGREGHFGLQGMRERAERIGSKFTLNSVPNSGTEMTLVVPGKVIFSKASATRFERIKTFFGLDRFSDLH